MENPINVLVTRDIPEKGIDLLRQAGFAVTVWTEDRPMTPEELLERAKDKHALLCTATEQINKAFLNACSHLDIITEYGAGYDNIDVEEATRLGIHVGNTPGAMADATADVAFGLMIATARKMFYMHKSIAKGEWTYFRPKANLGLELKNKTLGVVGLGLIGMELARRCRGAYNMEIRYYNRGRNLQAEQELNARKVSFDELLRQSDVISVHCNLTPETEGMFNRAAFSKMKPTSLFINTSRGKVHNEEDLIEALQNGTIWGAGLDVSNPEPMRPDNPLLSMENVSVLPHMGSTSIDARNRMSVLAAENIIGFYRDGKVPHLVNPEVLEISNFKSQNSN